MKKLLIAVLLGLSLSAYAATETFKGTVTVDCPTITAKQNIGGDYYVTCSQTVVQPPPQPPVIVPTIPATMSCAGLQNVIIIDPKLPTSPPPGQTWSQRYFTNKYGNFMADGIVVLKLTLPPNSGLYKITFAEDGDGQRGYSTARTAVLSTNPCDFNLPNIRSVNGSTAFLMQFSTNGYRNTTPLIPGQPYYLNVANRYNGAPSCGAEMCNGFFTIDIRK